MKGFDWSIVRHESETRLVLVGELTESTDLSPVMTERLSSPVVVDLGGITRINSCGLRAWIWLVLALNEAGLSIILDRCSPPIVGQLNLISNFVGREGTVRSVFAPYECLSCDLEHLELIDGETNGIDQIRCPECGNPAELSDLPEVYFSFWKPASS